MSPFTMGRGLFLAAASGCALLVLAAIPALATPTGLNNIPTADVVPKDLLVLQGFADFDGETSWFAGFKVGPAGNLEVGIDDLFSDAGSSTGPAFQAKYRIPLQHGERLALGVANVTGDRDRNGNTFPYAVISAPLGDKANGHLGYSVQEDNHALFLGADATVGKNVTLRSDWIQSNDGDESIWSLGFISPLSWHLLLEGWASFPSAAEADTSYVLKIDYVIALSG
jgi:hypothetical protein